MKRTPILNRPLDASMGPKVLEILSRMEKLPQSGCVAGQAVVSALLQLFAENPEHKGPVNDIDVFHTRFDRLLEAGDLDNAIEEENSLIKSHSIVKSDYSHAFEQRLNIHRVLNRGKLNLIEMTPSAVLMVDASKFTPAERLDTVISEFDLTSVQVGVDLKTGELRWTDGFERFMQGEPAQAAHIALSERTVARINRKSKEMPWIQWDSEQIQGMLEVAQIRNILTVYDHDKREKLMEGWCQRYGQDVQTANPLFTIDPIWKWHDWEKSKFTDAKTLLKEIRQKIGQNLDFMSPHASEHMALMIRFIDQQIIRNDENLKFEESMQSAKPKILIKSNDKKEELSSKNFITLTDPLSTLLALSDTTEAEIMDHLKKHPDALFDDVPIRPKKFRKKLMEHALEINADQLVDHLLNVGFSPNMRLEVGTPYSRLMGRPPVDQGHHFKPLLDKMCDLGADVSLPLSGNVTIAHLLLQSAPLENIKLQFDNHSVEKWSTKNADGLGPLHKILRSVVSRQESEKDIDSISSEKRKEEQLKLKEQKERVDFLLTKMPCNQKEWSLATLINRLEEELNDRYRAHDRGLEGLVRDLTKFAKLIQSCWDHGLKKDFHTQKHCPLIFHAIKNRDEPLFQFLLDSGVNVNAAATNGNTPLMVAIRGKDPMSMKMMGALMDRGANIEQQSNDGKGLVEHAIQHSNTAALKTLIDRGAQIDRLTGREGLHIAELSVTSNASIVQLVFSSLDPELGDRLAPLAIEHGKTYGITNREESEAVLQAREARRTIDKAIHGLVHAPGQQR